MAADYRRVTMDHGVDNVEEKRHFVLHGSLLQIEHQLCRGCHDTG